MMPLVDRPIIQYAVEEAASSGIEQIIIVIATGRSAIEDHFDSNSSLERWLEERGDIEMLRTIRRISEFGTVAFVHQREQLGLGHAVLMAKDLVGDEPFAVMLGDDIIDSRTPCMKQMVQVFEKHQGPVIAVHQVPRAEISAYGVIDGVAEKDDDRVYRINDLVEKPSAAEAPSDLAIIGRYILTPDIFEALATTPRDAAGEIQLTNGLRTLKNQRAMYGYRFEGVRHDAGNKLGFLKATVEFALKRDDLGGPFREYLKGLKL
jgi:UTP--glucose-1-phosphate uridylyltransferase